MRNISAKDAKYGFGRLIDLARAEPVTVEKHGRPVVVVLAIEEYERLRESATGAAPPPERPGAKRPAKTKGPTKA
jgi:prevent-host-death family protein